MSKTPTFSQSAIGPASPGPKTTRIREVIAALYMVLLVGSIYLAVTAESYRRWVTFGVISSLLLLGSIPVAIALILIPRRRAAALVATAQPASPEGLTRPSVLAPGLLLALGAALLLLTIVVGFLWPGP